MQKIKNILLALVVSTTLAVSTKAQTNLPPLTPGSALVLYDSTGEFGWIGGIHAEMLANLLGHFPALSYQIMPVESYRAGDLNRARATFYFGSVYDNPLPATFKADVLATTNSVCWFKYNIWQVDDTNFEAKVGFHFNFLDWSGYSNIVYKGESLTKDQLDPELGYVNVVNTNVATTPAIATKADGTSIPYITTGGKFWYIADSPFDYMEEQDRYLAFCDVLHDIVGIDAPASHSAAIRLEDVAPTMYDPATLMATADLLASNNVPFEIALVPIYTDPLGAYNSGVPEMHRMSDTNDADSVAFVSAIRYMMSKGAQLIIHGYTHQYSNVDNPYTGTSGDDFEFWRETFDTNSTVVGALDLYEPIPEDSVAWAQGRLSAARQELANVGLSPVGFENPHYAGSPTDYQVIATNFPMTMMRALYFDASGHIAGQFFPYVINEDLYGNKVVPENIGNIEPVPWLNYPAHSAGQMVADAKSTLVVRDGWAAGYFHPFYDLTNLQAIVTGVKALGYTYVKVSTSEAPSITAEPTNSTVAAAGTATFKVTAVGSGTLTYQWRLNGTNVAGAIAATLTLANVQPASAGNYSVVVANAFGSVTSSTATLTVQVTKPIITAQPASRTNALNTAASFSVTATGAATLHYQWRFNNANLAGATTATYAIAKVAAANAGNYTVVITNSFGSVTSAVATLSIGTAPAITTQPTSRTVAAGGSTTFTVVATGTPSLAYQWRRNGTNVSGATAASLTLANVQTANAGTYTVVITNSFGTVTSAGAVLTVTGGVAPAITTQPTSRSAVTGTSTTFSVTATGTATLHYQWRLNGANVSGATAATLTLANVQAANAGTYTVVVTNSFGTVTSAGAVLTVLTKPAITSQPANTSVKSGQTATFKVTATGSATLTYQWRHTVLGIPLNVSGGNSATLTLTKVTAANAGTYSVVVSNSAGSVTSANATLTVK